MEESKCGKIDECQIKNQLTTLCSNCELVFLEEAASTNSVACQLIKSGANNGAPFAVLARTQKAGRGRLSRSWFAAKDRSIALSVALPINLLSAKTFTLKAGVSVCLALNKILKTDFKIKWPNDIYTASAKKVAGMLAELHIAPRANFIVFGIGVNVDFTGIEVPQDIANTCADLVQNTQETVNINALCAQIIKAVEVCDSTPDWFESFAKLDFLHGKNVGAVLGNETFEGKACGIDSDARLKIMLADGHIKTLHSGEATLQKRF